MYQAHPLGLWLWGRRRSGMGINDNQHWDLGRPSFYPQSQSSNFSQGFAYLQDQIWCSLNSELGGVEVCWIWVPKQGVLLALGPGLPTLRQKSWVITSATGELGSWILPTLKSGRENVGVACNGLFQSYPGIRLSYSLTLQSTPPRPLWQEGLARVSGGFLTQPLLSQEKTWLSWSHLEKSQWPGNLRHRQVWVKTTKTKSGLEPASSTTSGQGN